MSNDIKCLSDDEFYKIALRLEFYNSIFSTIFSFGRICFSDEYERAWVVFNQDGECIDFFFNELFWNSLDDYHKDFVICHECLHVILNHGERMKKMGNISLANMATDIAINELLTRKFYFRRKKLEFNFDPCFIDTCFKNDEDLDKIPVDESSEYYYNRLKKSGNNRGNTLTIDNHTYGKLPKELQEKIEQEIERNLSAEEKQEFEKNINKSKDNISASAGSMAMGINKIVKRSYYKPKRKFERIVQNWITNNMFGSKQEDSWVFEHKRMVCIKNNDMIPGVHENTRAQEKGKLRMALFIDNSGSCNNLSQRFFDLCHGIPKHRFIVEAYSFDTNSYKLNLSKQQLIGGGGTCFKCISNQIYKKNDKKYDLVVIFTDGFGTSPNIPRKDRKKWFWLLTENGSKQCIPDGCKIYDLSKFE